MIHANALQPISVPVEALKQHAVVIGKTGSGKTYAAKGLVEHLLALGRRVVILDPTGAWWGLLSTADGRGEGFPVTIFGGDHAHVAITEHAGHAVADLVGSGNVPAVIDLSGTTLGERHRFVERFAETVYRVNRQPLHLIIDEADEFAPQSPGAEAARMLGAIDRIVRRGRIKGFRVLMISQRPAVLNKNVLTQANTMIVMRLPASQDRKAVEAWIQGQADESQAATLLGSLSGLKRGEGWVWAPELGVLERRSFPAIATFDSSRTPGDGEIIEAPRKLADVDLSAIKDAMAEAVRQAEDNDVTVLRKRIGELQARLDAAPKAAASAPTGVPHDQVRREVEAAVRAVRGRMVESLKTILAEFVMSAEDISARSSQLSAHSEALGSRVLALGRLVEQIPRSSPPGEFYNVDYEGRGERHFPPPAPRRCASAKPPQVTDAGHRADLSKPQQRLVDAIAWWNAIGIPAPTRVQVAQVAGYTQSGGTWKTLQSECRTAGVIEYQGDGLVLTDLGHRCAAHPEAAGTEELHERVLANLSGPQAKLFRVLVEHAGGAEISRTQAAELAGYEASGGTWKTLVSELSTLGLCRYPKKTTVQAAAWLFPERAK